MSEQVPEDVRSAITRAAEERSPSLGSLITAQYASLTAIARRIFARESPGHSLSPTVLVNEAFLRLCHQSGVTNRGELHFRACFAQECRRILVEHVRQKRAHKRGGDRDRESIADLSGLADHGQLDLIVIDDLIERLAQLGPRQARIVVMRVFGGLTVKQCADELGVSPRQVDKEWAFARAWLQAKVK